MAILKGRGYAVLVTVQGDNGQTVSEVLNIRKFGDLTVNVEFLNCQRYSVNNKAKFQV